MVQDHDAEHQLRKRKRSCQETAQFNHRRMDSGPGKAGPTAAGGGDARGEERRVFVQRGGMRELEGALSGGGFCFHSEEEASSRTEGKQGEKVGRS